MEMKLKDLRTSNAIWAREGLVTPGIGNQAFSSGGSFHGFRNSVRSVITGGCNDFCCRIGTVCGGLKVPGGDKAAKGTPPGTAPRPSY